MDKLIEMILNRDVWPTWIGLVIMLVVASVGIVAADQLTKEFIEAISWRGSIYVVVLGFVICLWYWNRNRLPARVIAKDTGFNIVLAIGAEDDETRRRLETDFVSEFNRQIVDSNVSDLFHLTVTDAYLAGRIRRCIESLESGRLPGRHPDRAIEREWDDIHKGVEGDLYLWGSISRRQGNKYVLRFNGFTNDELHPSAKEDLTKDYLAFGVSKRLIDFDNEIEGFELEARFYYIFAKYVISFVALYNLKVDTSHRLHKSLESDFRASENFDGKNHLVGRLRTLISIEHVLFARKKFNEGDYAAAEHDLTSAESYDPRNGNIYMFWAIVEFLVRRRIQSALNHVYRVRDLAEPDQLAWRYSEAFLRMYNGEYREALSIYEMLIKSTSQEESLILDQVIHFNEKVMPKADARFIEAQFILALIKGRKLNDPTNALPHLTNFLDSAGRSAKYTLLRNEALSMRKAFNMQLALDRHIDGLMGPTD